MIAPSPDQPKIFSPTDSDTDHPVVHHNNVILAEANGTKSTKMEKGATIPYWTKWFESFTKGKLQHKCWFVMLWTTIRVLLVLTFMYFFVCSLSLMSDAFRLIAGVKLGKVFRHNPLLQNPVVDLMIGALVTMAIHSSGTTTAIMISMTAANVMPVDNAIYVLFGAEIGTSITNTMVSIGHIADRDDFRRAFSGATMHSVFNWITVLIFFPLECSTHMLRRCAELMVENIQPHSNANADREFLNAIIKPLTQKIIRLDKDVISQIATDQINETNFTTMIKATDNFLFSRTTIPDTWVGVILLFCALACLFGCLAGVAKTMNSMLASSFAKVIKRYINSDLPGRWKPLTGYIFIWAGAVMTAIIQSSTVFTSTLTPMVGVGVISVERVFPLILGANIGTTLDNILGALAQDANVVKIAMTVALYQVLFNIFGVLLFYPIPFLRNTVIKTGKWLGRNTCRYRWFAFVYIFVLFIFLPLLGIGLSLGGELVMYCVGVPLVIFVVVISLINALQCQKPSLLPSKLHTWDWLPEPMHSLEPYDRWLNKMCFCCKTLTRNANAESKEMDSSERVEQTCQNGRTVLDCDNEVYSRV